MGRDKMFSVHTTCYKQILVQGHVQNIRTLKVHKGSMHRMYGGLLIMCWGQCKKVTMHISTYV